MKRAALTIFSLSLFLTIALPTFAQGLSTGAAIGMPINVKVSNGDIITSVATGYQLANSPYDPQIFGVVSLNPAVYLKNITAGNVTPVISSGQVQVRVSSINGNIAAGDFVTSSTLPGIGQKATENGYILGRADQSYSSNDPHKTGLILVTLQPHYAQLTTSITRNIFSALTFGITAAVDTPLGVIRYFVAGGITIFSFLFGFRFFGRASNRGVEAIGRNPLAKQAILLSVFINTVITIAIMFFGVAISYLILVL